MDSQNLLDVFLVGALSIIALTSLIFMFYFVPVLIQLAKTLEAIKDIAKTLNYYVSGISHELDKLITLLERTLGSVGLGIASTGAQAVGALNLLKSWLDDFINPKK